MRRHGRHHLVDPDPDNRRDVFSGTNVVIGHDGLTVPVTAPTGVCGGLWQRSVAAHFDVKWFGAKSDWQWNNATRTDNLAICNAVIAAMPEEHNKANRLLADGWFYLSETFILTRTIAFEGSGQNEPTVDARAPRPARGSSFPERIRIHSAAPLDNPRGTGERWFCAT